MTTSTTTNETAPATITASADNHYRVRRYILCTAVALMGFYFLYDGFIGYPKHNDQIDDLTKQRDTARAKDEKSPEVIDLQKQLDKIGDKHSEKDIDLQQKLGMGLIPFAPILLGFFIYRSRGAFVLTGTTLTAPGHPTIDLADIEEIDDALWKKKGIAKLRYKHANKTGIITLDDDKYDRPNINQIYKAIITHMGIEETPISRLSE